MKRAVGVGGGMGGVCIYIFLQGGFLCYLHCDDETNLG
jgi:hypothetical protein